jgi:chromosome partitioning protein
MIKIVVANQKGGVAKTTTAVTLAHGLALKNYSVLLIDLDPQGQCATLLGMEQEPGVFDLLVNGLPLRDVVRATGREGLHLLPGSKRTATAQTVLLVEGYRVDALAGVLDGDHSIDSDVHYVVVDTAPSAGGLQENALYAADVLLVPSAVDHLSLEGVAGILTTLHGIERPHRPLVRIVPTFHDERTRESKANLASLQEQFGEAVVLAPIHRATVARECAALGRTVFERCPKHRAAKEYGALVWEVIDATR